MIHIIRRGTTRSRLGLLRAVLVVFPGLAISVPHLCIVEVMPCLRDRCIAFLLQLIDLLLLFTMRQGFVMFNILDLRFVVAPDPADFFVQGKRHRAAAIVVGRICGRIIPGSVPPGDPPTISIIEAEAQAPTPSAIKPRRIVYSWRIVVRVIGIAVVPAVKPAAHITVTDGTSLGRGAAGKAKRN